MPFLGQLLFQDPMPMLPSMDPPQCLLLLRCCCLPTSQCPPETGIWAVRAGRLTGCPVSRICPFLLYLYGVALLRMTGSSKQTMLMIWRIDRLGEILRTHVPVFCGGCLHLEMKRWHLELRSLLSSTYSTQSLFKLCLDLGLSSDFTRTFFEWDYCQAGPSPVLVQSEQTAWTQTGLGKILWTVLELCSDCPKTSNDLFNIIKKWPQPELNPGLNIEISQ